MKRILLVAACIVATASALAQGTVNFANKVAASGINAQVTTSTGTPLDSTYLAQLYAGATEGSLAAQGSPIAFKANGYFLGGTVQINGIAAGGAAVVQVRAWANSYASYEAAVAANGAVGSSASVSLSKTGDPTASPPGTPVDLVGLASFKLSAGGSTTIPEPTTVALGALAAGALLLFRRK